MKAKSKQCSIEGCERKFFGLGFCNMHYLRVRAGIADMRPGRLPSAILGGKWRADDPRYRNKNKPCAVPGCTGKYYAKDLCRNHYNRKLKKGCLASSVRFYGKCSVSECEANAIGLLGFCAFHRERNHNGIDLNRPKGINGELNPHWNGGVAEYPNHSQMKKIRKTVLEEENYTCFYCGKPTKQIHHTDNTKSNHDRSNLHACCHSCNIKFAGSHQSKYTKIYGKHLSELAEDLGIYAAKVIKMHRNGELRTLFIKDEVKAVLF